MEELDLGGDLAYSERPIKILDTTERVTHRRSLRCAKFSGGTIERMKLPASTKKSSEQITPRYFHVLPKSRGRDSSKGVGL
jgi:hypothetical protein